MVSGLRSQSYEDQLKELDMLSLEERRTLYDLVQTFKIIRNFDDVSTSTWFELVGNVPPRVTRNTSDTLNIVRQNSQTDIRRNFFSNQVVDKWNNLSSELKHCCSIEMFENNVKVLLKTLFDARPS